MQLTRFAAQAPCDRLAQLEPGVTTQAEVRARLGTPWSAAEAWRAEIYAGEMV